MKKILFFAYFLAMITIPFTSCEKSSINEPEQPDAVLPKDYRYSSWRLDSIHSQRQMHCPGVSVYVCSDSMVIINGDSIVYEYKDSTFICRGVNYSVKTAKWDYAVLSDGTADFYLSRFPIFAQDDLLSDDDPDNLLGMWKLLCYVPVPDISEIYTQEYINKNMRTNPGVEVWDLQIAGNAIYHNLLNGKMQQGQWEHKPGYMKDNYDYPGSIDFVNNPAGEREFLFIKVLTPEWMCLITPEDKDACMWYFVRVK